VADGSTSQRRTVSPQLIQRGEAKEKPVHHVRAALAIVVCLLAIPFTSAAAPEDAAAWCTSHDGTVVERYPASMASSDKPVALGAPVQFCEFTGGEGADPSDSHISVALTTLTATVPSMAATAYLTKPAMPESGGSANPASIYCADLGGAELGGQLAPDGGWVNSDDTSDVAELCVFPDLSVIDSWGLAYHTMGTIRGANLESIFRWQPAE
jgi:putative hemolysin